MTDTKSGPTEKKPKKSPKITKMREKALAFEMVPEKIAKRKSKRAAYAADFMLWATECAKIIDRDDSNGAQLIPFCAAPSQLDFLRLREEIKKFNITYSTRLNAIQPKHPISEKPIEMVCLKARKVYVSTIIQLLKFWTCEFVPDTFALTMAHKQIAARNISAISRRVHKKWSNQTDPPTREPLSRISDDLIEWNDEHRSKMVVMTAGSTDESSRSFTYHFIHLSEAAMFPDANREVANAEQAAATYREIYTESTAHGEGNAFHDEWENAMWLSEAWECLQNNKPFKENWNKKFRWFWAWWQDDGYRIPCMPYERQEIERTLSEREQKLIDNYLLQHEQGDLENVFARLKWRRSKIAGECSKQSDMPAEDYFCQEYPADPEEAFIAKGSNVFDKRALKDMRDATKHDKPRFGHLNREAVFDPDHPELDVSTFRFDTCEQFESAQWFVWEDPIPSHWYSIGGDVSEGLPWGDDSGFVVHDRTDGTFLREVARFIGRPDPHELAELAVYVAKIYNDAFITMERNKDGSATNIYMVKELEYPHLYHGRNEELFKNKEDPEAFTAGFITSPKTKRLLVAKGKGALKEKTLLLRHPKAIEQWLTYQRKPGMVDAFGAPEGKLDDCVMMDLLAIWGDEEGPPVMGKVLQKAAELQEDKRTEQQKYNDYMKERIGKFIANARKKNEREEKMRINLSAVDILEN